MIGPILRLFRIVKGLSLDQMADAIGVSKSTLSRVESGHQMSQEIMLILISYLFNPKHKTAVTVSVEDTLLKAANSTAVNLEGQVP